MSVQYSGGREVYNALDKLFDDLSKKKSGFLEEFNKKLYAGFSSENSENGDVVSIWGNDDKDKEYIEMLFDGVEDEDYHEPVDNISSIELTDIFNYRKEDAYLYISEVTMDSGKFGTSIMVTENVVDDYPSKDDILVRKRGSVVWEGFSMDNIGSFVKYLLGISNHINNTNDMGIRNRIYRMHMDGSDSLVVTGYHPVEGSMIVSPYSADKVYSYCKEVVRLVQEIGKPISDIYWFVDGDYANGVVRKRIKKNDDGEYTIVIS